MSVESIPDIYVIVPAEALIKSCRKAMHAHGFTGIHVVCDNMAASIPVSAQRLQIIAEPHRLGADLSRLAAMRSRKEPDIYAVGPYQLYVWERALVLPDQKDEAARITLTDRECDILVHLARAGGNGVYRDDLLKNVWGYNAAVETHTLETHIYRLRQKIEQDPSAPQILLTSEAGYCLAK